MKKYNCMILLTVCLYLLMAFLSGYGIRRVKFEQNRIYKVEINRIYHQVQEELAAGVQTQDKESLVHGRSENAENDREVSSGWNRSPKSCRWVKKIVYLPASKRGQEEITQFYEEDKDYGMEIRPVYIEGKLQGFLRFDYVKADFNYRYITWMVQLGLGLMELSCLCILFYIKHRILLPFQRMKRLPYEMAQGHLKGTVKEEKNRFFGQFLWGIGQLKDSLETSRRRTLELEKEKKLLLLSLSHDVKTPLNSIKLYAKALREDLYQEEDKRMSALGQIMEKTAEIERYVEEIMRNSREDILDIQVDNQEFYLKNLLERVLQVYEEKCAVRMVELTVGTYENRLLKGDLDRAVEVFENIFENAFKYGDGRTIEISFYEEDDCQLIRIFNSGEPVSENEWNHIFESFFRAANSKGKQGNGLGLYICREIMQKMGGSVFAERREDGMAFVLVFA